MVNPPRQYGPQIQACLGDRQQRTADRYAGGDQERLHRMWMSGELDEIYCREAITEGQTAELARARSRASEQSRPRLHRSIDRLKREYF